MDDKIETLALDGWVHLKNVDPFTMQDPGDESMLEVEITRPEGPQPDHEILREYRLMYPGYNQFRIADDFDEDGNKTHLRSVYAKK